MYTSYKKHHTFVFAVLVNYGNNIECSADLAQLNSKNAEFGLMDFFHLILELKSKYCFEKEHQYLLFRAVMIFFFLQTLGHHNFPFFISQFQMSALPSNIVTGIPAKCWCGLRIVIFTGVNQTISVVANWNAFIRERQCLTQIPLNQKIAFYEFQVHGSERKIPHLFTWICSQHCFSHLMCWGLWTYGVQIQSSAMFL